MQKHQASQSSQDCGSQCPWPHSRPLLIQFRSMPPPETPMSTQASLPQSLVGSLLLSPGSWCTQDFLCALQESLLPQACGNSVIKSCWPSKSDSLGIFSPFWIPRLGSLLWSLELSQQCENFFGVTVLQFVSRLPDDYSGANGDLLQEDLSHTLHLPGLLSIGPLSMQEAAADSCLCRRPSDTQRQVWLSLLWGSLLSSLSPGTRKVFFVPSKCHNMKRQKNPGSLF